MADLSNLKIKNTYQNLLQLDSSVLQNLLGNEPNPFIINGNLRYVDGNQQDGYVLKSNAVGDAIWGSVSAGDLYVSAATLDNTFLRLETTSGSTIVTPVSYWSSDGKGNYANSGLTGNIGIGTTTPNKKLTVIGSISATTSLEVSGNITTSLSGDVITQDILLGHSGAGGHGFGGSIRPAISGRPVTFRNYDHGSAEWLSLQEDEITFFINGQAYNIFNATNNQFNATHIESRFAVHSKKANRLIEGSPTVDTICLANQGSTAIGGGPGRWATSNGYDNGTPNKTLQVNGLTHILSGSSGSATSWSADTTALKVVGNTNITGAISADTIYFNTINGGTF